MVLIRNQQVDGELVLSVAEGNPPVGSKDFNRLDRFISHSSLFLWGLVVGTFKSNGV